MATALAGLGVERRIALVVPHFAAAPGVVAASDLAVAVPRQLAGCHAAARAWWGWRCRSRCRASTLPLYWHERLQEDAASRWLRGLLVRLFGLP